MFCQFSPTRTFGPIRENYFWPTPAFCTVFKQTKVLGTNTQHRCNLRNELLVIRNAAKTNNKYSAVTFMVKTARASEISPPGAVKAYPAPKAFKAKLKSSLAALECICIDEVPGGCGFMGTEVNLCGITTERAFSCTDVTCV